MADCERSSLSLNSLYAALREITHDQPTEASALLLAEALDCLPADAYGYLVEEARRSLVSEANSGAQRALEQAGVYRSVERPDFSVGSRRAEPYSKGPR
jgi:uroporphyrinogen-III synthase